MSENSDQKGTDEHVAMPVTSSTELAVAVPPALVAARQVVEELRRHTKSENTRTAYEADWRRFLGWATKNRACPMPATPETVCLYLGWLSQEEYSLATVGRFLAAGVHFHRASGFDFPRNTPAVIETIKGIRRTTKVKRVKKAPFGLKTLAEACARLQHEAENAPEPERRIECVRNRAMLTVGWFCALRSDNLVAIRREHVRLVRVDDDGWIDDYDQPNGLVLHLPSSKTDQFQEGRDVPVLAQENEIVCPIRALQELFRAKRFGHEDLIFPVSRRTVSRLVKRLAANPEHGHKTMLEIENCEACSSTARRFASHSLRRGIASKMAQDGIQERAIMRHGGWKNERVARGYMEDATLFQNNPTKGLSSATTTTKKLKEEPTK